MNVATQAFEASVSPAYQHHQRLVEAGPPLPLGGGALKWYVIRRPQSPLPDGLVRDAQAFLRGEMEAGRLDIAGQAGFVMLHLADGPGGRDSVALLMVSTWRCANELWESVYAKALDGTSGYRRVPKGDHAATYCVWELAPVWHERSAWSRYLESARDGAAHRSYLEDVFAGIVS